MMRTQNNPKKGIGNHRTVFLNFLLGLIFLWYGFVFLEGKSFACKKNRKQDFSFSFFYENSFVCFFGIIIFQPLVVCYNLVFPPPKCVDCCK